MAVPAHKIQRLQFHSATCVRNLIRTAGPHDSPALLRLSMEGACPICSTGLGTPRLPRSGVCVASRGLNVLVPQQLVHWPGHRISSSYLLHESRGPAPWFCPVRQLADSRIRCAPSSPAEVTGVKFAALCHSICIGVTPLAAGMATKGGSSSIAIAPSGAMGCCTVCPGLGNLDTEVGN